MRLCCAVALLRLSADCARHIYMYIYMYIYIYVNVFIILIVHDGCIYGYNVTHALLYGLCIQIIDCFNNEKNIGLSTIYT